MMSEPDLQPFSFPVYCEVFQVAIAVLSRFLLIMGYGKARKNASLQLTLLNCVQPSFTVNPSSLDGLL